LVGNPDVQRCTKVGQIIEDPAALCHQITWGRQYWSILRDAINKSSVEKLSYCPAMKDGYQLLRQQALAQGIANAGLFDYVLSGVAYDKRNTELIGCLSELGIMDFTEDWAPLMNSGVIFHCFTHQELVLWVTRSHDPFVSQWGDYIKERYGYNQDLAI
jgi:hypothetical protein